MRWLGCCRPVLVLLYASPRSAAASSAVCRTHISLTRMHTHEHTNACTHIKHTYKHTHTSVGARAHNHLSARRRRSNQPHPRTPVWHTAALYRREVQDARDIPPTSWPRLPTSKVTLFVMPVWKQIDGIREPRYREISPTSRAWGPRWWIVPLRSLKASTIRSMSALGSRSSFHFPTWSSFLSSGHH